MNRPKLPSLLLPEPYELGESVGFEDSMMSSFDAIFILIR